MVISSSVIILGFSLLIMPVFVYPTEYNGNIPSVVCRVYIIYIKRIFGIPKDSLAEVLPSGAEFG